MDDIVILSTVYLNLKNGGADENLIALAKQALFHILEGIIIAQDEE